MIELYARDRVGDLNFRAETLTVLGWTSPGTRKVGGVHTHARTAR